MYTHIRQVVHCREGCMPTRGASARPGRVAMFYSQPPAALEGQAADSCCMGRRTFVNTLPQQGNPRQRHPPCWEEIGACNQCWWSNMKVRRAVAIGVVINHAVFECEYSSAAALRYGRSSAWSKQDGWKQQQQRKLGHLQVSHTQRSSSVRTGTACWLQTLAHHTPIITAAITPPTHTHTHTKH